MQDAKRWLAKCIDADVIDGKKVTQSVASAGLAELAKAMQALAERGAVMRLHSKNKR